MPISELNFCFDVPNVSQKSLHWSPTVIVCGIPWKIRVERKFVGPKPSLGIYLYCVKKDEEWSYVASMSIKLFSFNTNVEAFEHSTEPFVFDSNNPDTGYGTPSFIDWDSLFDENKNYVRNDAIELAIKIEVTNPNELNKSEVIFNFVKGSCKVDCFTKFDLIIKNIEHLRAVKTPKFTLRNSPHTLSLKKFQNQLVVSSNANESLRYMIVLKLFSTKGSDKSLMLLKNKIISWNDLLKPENGFVNNDSVKMEITFLANSVFEYTRNALQTMNSTVSIPRFVAEIPNISQLNEGMLLPEVMIYGIPWSTKICKIVFNEKPALVIFLRCGKSDTSSNWSCVASFSVKLLTI